MIPDTLGGWSIEVVKALVQRGIFESDRFDFKEQLPHKSDDKDKLRLVKTCASFANSIGGFLIFGVKDDKGLSPADRLVGLDAVDDFPERFGNFPAIAEPSVEWTFRNPALSLENGRLIHVVHVVESQSRPHAVLEQDRWWFCKRTSKGTEIMSYDEVRLAFQDTETKRTKLALLSAELDHTIWIADRVLQEVPEEIPDEHNGTPAHWSWATRYSTTLIDSLLGDAVSLFAKRREIWTSLARLRDELRHSNAVAEAFAHFVFEQATYTRELRATQHVTMRESAKAISSFAKTAKLLVDGLLAQDTRAFV